MLPHTMYFEAEEEVLDYLTGTNSFNESITSQMKLLEKLLWQDVSTEKYEANKTDIEDIVNSIQELHQEDDFYLMLHKFTYVEPEDTAA